MKTEQQQQQPRAPSNSTFPNSVINFSDNGHNHAHSSDDDDDGGEEQDDESDSTECSSSDNEENTSSLGDTSISSSSSIDKCGEALQTLLTSRDFQPERTSHGVDAKAGTFVENVTSRGCDLRITTWPTDRPLPYPAWDTKEPQEVVFKDILEYEEFAGHIEHISQQTVSTHKYNTVGNYIR